MIWQFFNLVSLYRLAFGYVAPPFPNVSLPSGNNTVAGALEADNGRVRDRETRYEGELSLQVANRTVAGADRQSMLGNAFAMPTAFRLTEADPWEWLPNEPIISVEHRNAVAVTKINLSTDNTRPRRGSVKEIIALEDYEITIQGIAINETEQFYPEDQMNMIREFVEHPGSILVQNYFLNSILNIQEMTVLRSSYPRAAGMPFEAQPYVIRALSDEDFEL
jgi:hypothetical protein